MATDPSTVMTVNEVITRSTYDKTQVLNSSYCNGFLIADDTREQAMLTDVSSYRKNWVRTPGWKTLVKRKPRPVFPDNHFEMAKAFTSPGEVVFRDQRRLTSPPYGPWDVCTWDRQKTIEGARFGWFDGGRTINDNIVRMRLLSKVRGQSVNVPVVVLEARKTANLVTNTAIRLARVMRLLRRGKFIEACRLLGFMPTPGQKRKWAKAYGVNPERAASSIWLEIQYGWTPLLHDVYDSAQTLASLMESEWFRIGTVRSSLVERRKINREVVWNTSPERGTYSLTANVTESCRGIWRFSPGAWGQAAQLGLTNPALVVWELVPLSFVADWLIPISDWLEGLDIPFLVKHVGGSIGYKRYTEWTMSGFTLENWQAGEGELSSYNFHVEREPLIDYPKPGLDGLTFDPKLGTKRLLSALALLQVAFGRK